MLKGGRELSTSAFMTSPLHAHDEILDPLLNIET